MKNLFKLSLILTVLFFFQKSFAQQSEILTRGDDNIYTYEKVFEVAGKSKEQIYDGLKSWIIKNIKTGDNNNYFDDKTKAAISTTPAFGTQYGSVDFKLGIDVKDGKYRVTGSSFTFYPGDGNTREFGNFKGLFAPKSAQKKIYEKFDEQFQALIDGLKSAAQSGAKDDNW